MTSPRRHALVVGGTGMLRQAAFGLVARGFAVSVVNRDARLLDGLRDAAGVVGGEILPVCVDWRDPDAFAFGMDECVRDYGPPSLGVVWLHPAAAGVPGAVAQELDAGEPGARLYLLVAPGPPQGEAERRALFAQFRRISYHEIVLGPSPGSRETRRLTDEEISAGILEAVDSGAPRTVLGRTAQQA